MPDFDIEQVNRVRKAMGMKPLPAPGGDTGPTFKDAKAESSSDEEPASTLELREAAAGDNWKKLQAEAEAKEKRQAQKAKIKKARDAAQRFAKLEGQGLADDDGDQDTKSWLKGQKKRQAAIDKARKYEQELAERERQAEYTSADLAGVKVGHQLSHFDEEAGEQVLTLKDAAVDAESEDDELENVGLRDRERLEERLESKKKRPAYNPIDETEGKRGILAQYDEEIDGKKTQRFTLDGQGSTREAAFTAGNSAQDRKGVVINLDILSEDVPVSDYKDASEVKVKKPKKSKSKVKKRKAEDDDDIFPAPVLDVALGNGNSNGNGSITAKRRRTEDNFVDDEDLQASLASQRLAALKKRKKRTPEDIAREIREEGSATPGAMDEDDDSGGPGMVIDETSEFLANLQLPIAREKARESSSSQPLGGVSFTSAALRPAEEQDEADSDEDMQDVKDERASDDEEAHAAAAREDTTTGLEDEASLNRGLGASLNLLKQRGVIKTAESGDLNAIFRDRQRFLAEKQQREVDAESKARLQRERDRQSGKLDRMSARDREEYARRTNASRDQMESRQLADVFNREYKPDVQLKYVDEFGRNMDAKEAFKHLSHQFHGKGSGKQKTEKKLKKMEDEKKQTAMSVLDASQNSTNMNSVAGERSKRSRQAGVRLQ